MAETDEAVVRAVVSDREGSRIKTGQRTTLQLDGKSGLRVEGEVVSVTELRNNGGYLAQVAVDWNDTPGMARQPRLQ